MTTLIAILAMAIPAERPAEAVPPCDRKGYVMVGPRCKRHPRHHAGHVRKCFTYRCDRRMTRKMERRRIRAYRSRMWRVVAPYQGWLRSLAWCESTNRPWAVDPSGTYFGLYQFDLQTWRSVGGSGMPNQASRLEQGYRAVLLRQRRGTAPWPVCG